MIGWLKNLFARNTKGLLPPEEEPFVEEAFIPPGIATLIEARRKRREENGTGSV